jgi:hypothetical protein
VRPFSRPLRATENFHTARKTVKYDLFRISVSMLKSKSPPCGLPRTFRIVRAHALYWPRSFSLATTCSRIPETRHVLIANFAARPFNNIGDLSVSAVVSQLFYGLAILLNGQTKLHN